MTSTTPPSRVEPAPGEGWNRWRPFLGGALIVAAMVLAALWLDDVLRSDAYHPDTMDRARQICVIDFQETRVPVRAGLFEGAFAGRGAWADSLADRWGEILSGDFAPTMRSFLARAASHRPLIQPVLERHGIPDDFLYLAVIESGLNPNAVSRAGAAGPWQFMYFTAQDMGLEVGGVIDERRDLVASTDAAARYLAELYDEFGDWALAAAAYNAGPHRIRQAMRVFGEDTYWELARRDALPRETRNYVPKLIAAAHLARDPGGAGLGFVPSPPPPDWRVVNVGPASRLDVIADAAGIPLEEIEALNPHLRDGISPPRPDSPVRLPADAHDRFMATYFDIPAEERRGRLVHEVRPRETLSGIAFRYGVSVDRLVAHNRVDPRRLQVGQAVEVPIADTPGPAGR